MTLISATTKIGESFDLRARPPSTSFDEIACRISLPSAINFVHGSDVDDVTGRVWAVHLTAWQVSGTVNSSFPRNQAVLPRDSLHAVITFASDGASESIVVDYPAAGTTVLVSGQFIEVHLVGVTSPSDPTRVPPIIGAFVVPAAGLVGPRTATLTTPTGGIGPSASVGVAVPVRARGYQLLVSASPTGPFNMAQLDGHGDPTGVVDFWSDGDSTRNGAAVAGAYRLHPDCQSLLITNLGAVSSGIYVQWDLQTVA
jgi:hypothetical protein